MKTRVIREKDGYYYVQFLEPKTHQANFASEFLITKWKFYGASDSEGQFNRIPYGCSYDAIEKAKELSGYNVQEVIWQSA